MTTEPNRARWQALALLSIAELLGMSLWFSGSAVVPALTREWHLSPSQISWIAIAVQLGFFAVSSFLGAAVNWAFGLYSLDPSTAILLRFLTGVCLAGVYPPGMKIMATWFRERRGMALGVLVGALTMGKATPYLVNAIGSERWRVNILFVSLLAAVGGLIVLFFVDDGPY